VSENARSTEPSPLGRNRDFLILWLGEAVSALGSSMSTLVFPLVGYSLTGSAGQAGLATAAVLLGRVVARLPAGALVDRWPRGRVLWMANLFGAACYGSLAAAAFTHHLTIQHLVVVGFLGGVADSFFAPAASAAIRTVVPAAQLPLAYTRLAVREHAAELVGPPLGGALFSLGRGLPFLVDAITYAFSAVSMIWVRHPLPAPASEGTRTSMRVDVAEGLRFVWRHAATRAILTWGAAVNFSVTLALVTVTLRLVRAGVHPAAIGLVDSIAAASGLVGALVAPAIIARMPTGMTAITTGLVLPLVVFPMAWTTNVAVIGALLAIGIFLLPANNSGISAYLVTIVPDRLQGRVNAAGGFVAEGVTPLAPALAGLLVGSVGGETATILGAVLLTTSVIPLLASSEIRGLGRPDTWKAHSLPSDDGHEG
jgi:MFS family permease